MDGPAKSETALTRHGMTAKRDGFPIATSSASMPNISTYGTIRPASEKYAVCMTKATLLENGQTILQATTFTRLADETPERTGKVFFQHTPCLQGAAASARSEVRNVSSFEGLAAEFLRKHG